jgi:hypothetical protein
MVAGRGHGVRDLPSLAGKDLTNIRAALSAAGMRDATTPDAASRNMETVGSIPTPRWCASKTGPGTMGNRTTPPLDRRS